MRDDIIAYLEANIVTGFTVTDELPWTSSNVPLYVKNKNVVYTSLDQVEQEPLLDTLDGLGFANEVSTVEVFVSSDAKTIHTNYDALVTMIKDVNSDAAFAGQTARVTDIVTDYVEDALVSTFAISLTQLVASCD